MDNGTGNGINDLNPTDDPFWIDDAWLDTIVVLSLTTFVLCLMGLAKVRVKRIQQTDFSSHCSFTALSSFS